MNKKQLEHKISRTKEMISCYDNKKDYLSVHGYWDFGYQVGRLSVLEDLLDEMESEVEVSTGGVSDAH